jgi:hypothetical protein
MHNFCIVKCRESEKYLGTSFSVPFSNCVHYDYNIMLCVQFSDKYIFIRDKFFFNDC